MENVLVSIAIAFGEIGKAAARPKMKAPARIAATYLGKMGNTPAFTRTKKEIVAVIYALGEIGKNVMCKVWVIYQTVQWLFLEKRERLRQARTSRTQH